MSLCIVKSDSSSFSDASAKPVERVGFGATNKPEERLSVIAEAIQSNSQLTPIVVQFEESTCLPREVLLETHDEEYVDFIFGAHADLVLSKDPNWIDAAGALVPNHVPDDKPRAYVPLYKQVGWYVRDCMSPILCNTAVSASVSAHAAYVAAERALEIVETTGQKRFVAAYALVDSPGHHAKRAQANGYCYFNNAVIAARRLQQGGKKRVAILDVDFHAGNGTSNMVQSEYIQDIFAVSLHADPAKDYPSYEGYEEENVDQLVRNIILPVGATWNDYKTKLDLALHLIEEYNPDALVIAFGGDTYKDDPDASPIARMALELQDYVSMGNMIASRLMLSWKLPTVITQEGGYCIEAMGTIASNFLIGLTLPVNKN